MTVLSAVSSGLVALAKLARSFFGLEEKNTVATRTTVLGLAASGIFLLTIGIWLFAVEGSSILSGLLIAGLLGFGAFNLLNSFAKRPSMGRCNQLALAGHLVALLTFYFVSTKFLNVMYTTDSIVGTYLGVVKTLQLQNPYAFSIKPLLDQLGFPPSFYTPRIDGSFEFHLSYPALNFLSLIPFYLAGMHDLRDGVLIFHLLSILILFGLAPSRLKALSILPFMLAGPVIVSSWTDSIWAFFVLLSAVSWSRNRKASFVLIGLAGAAKQIALAIMPFMIIRQWRENSLGEKKQNILKSVALMLGGFFLPNIPFLLSNPGAWWDSTVVTYLPGSTAQVPGGMGLSAILIELGITVPTWFYVYATISAFMILAYAYAVRFDRLNKYMWAFPMLLFLFYYRSFPNYIVYWSFPLIMELTRWKNLQLRAPFRLPRLALPFVPAIGRFSGVLRRRFTPLVIIVMIVATLFGGVSGVYFSRSNSSGVQVQVNSALDPDNIGAATFLNVTVRNTGPNPISPVFFVKWNLLANIWNSSNSPALLQPKSEQSYLIRASDALAAVPRGTVFRILVSDRFTQQLIAESALTTSKIPSTPVVNPLFKWWTIDTATGKKIPFGWRLTVKNVDLASSGIEPLNMNGTSGLAARLNYTATDNGPAQLELSQKLPFNATNINILLNESLTTSVARNVLFGASITDGTHLLYYVFSDVATSTSTVTYLTNTTVTVPVSKSNWNSFQMRPLPAWLGQGWNVPDQVTISFFLRAATPGVYHASISQVELSLPTPASLTR